jgi:hypothetical protein
MKKQTAIGKQQERIAKMEHDCTYLLNVASTLETTLVGLQKSLEISTIVAEEKVQSCASKAIQWKTQEICEETNSTMEIVADQASFIRASVEKRLEELAIEKRLEELAIEKQILAELFVPDSNEIENNEGS